MRSAATERNLTGIALASAVEEGWWNRHFLRPRGCSELLESCRRSLLNPDRLREARDHCERSTPATLVHDFDSVERTVSRGWRVPAEEHVQPRQRHEHKIRQPVDDSLVRRRLDHVERVAVRRPRPRVHSLSLSLHGGPFGRSATHTSFRADLRRSEVPFLGAAPAGPTGTVARHNVPSRASGARDPAKGPVTEP